MMYDRSSANDACTFTSTSRYDCPSKAIHVDQQDYDRNNDTAEDDTEMLSCIQALPSQATPIHCSCQDSHILSDGCNFQGRPELGGDGFGLYSAYLFAKRSNDETSKKSTCQCKQKCFESLRKKA